MGAQRTNMSKKETSIPDRILATALSLFNEFGFQTVTVRKISQRLDISAGHVGYHFKTKEDIAVALFPLLEEEMHRDVLDVVKPGQAFTGAVGARDAIAIVRTMWRYRFIFVSLNSLLKEDDSLRERYLALQEHITSFAERAFKSLIALKEMEQPQPPNSPRTLAETWWLMWMGWLRAQELAYHSHENLPDAVTYHGALLTYGVVAPYISDEFSKSFIRNAQKLLPKYKA